VTRIETAARSDVGGVRPTNEDSVLCVELGGGQWLLAVADGVGGVDGGGVASTAIVSELDVYVRHLRETGESDGEVLLRAGYAGARTEFDSYATAEGYPHASTTLVAAVVDVDGNEGGEATATVLSVGDSRAYLFEDGTLRQVTTDHTLATRRGVSGAQSHVLSRWVGVEAAADPDVFVEPLADTLLLCSDGLTNELSDREIRSVLARRESVAVRAETLVDRALARGGRDNVTVVLASVRM
jgi:protein phosphatase